MAVEAVAAGRVLVARRARAEPGAPGRAPTSRSRLPAPAAQFVSRGGAEARGRARRVRARRAAACVVSTSARRPAGSPTACCSAAPRTWSRSTSGAGSSRGRCATTQRVTVMERTNVRHVEPERDRARGPTSASSTCRSSRCARSRRTCSRLTTPDADFVLLVKPQFEAGRARVGKGGIVRDPEVAARRRRRGRRRPRRARARRARADRVADHRCRRQRRVPRPRASRRRDDDRRADARRRSRGRRVSALKAVGLVPHRERAARARARAARGRVVPRARRRGPRAARGGRGRGTRGTSRATRRSSSAGSISCITLGGDGTMLLHRAARVPGARCRSSASTPGSSATSPRSSPTSSNRRCRGCSPATTRCRSG